MALMSLSDTNSSTHSMSDAPPMPGAPPLSVLIQVATHLQAAKYFLVAAYVMLLYDHLITFGDEIERIWKQPWSGATILFALNRYVTLLQQPIIITAFTSSAWSRNVPACEHFVRFEGGSTLALVAICEIIMMLRVYAVWHKDRRILAILAFFWFVQIALCGMALGFGKRVPFPPIFVGCILTGANNLWSPFWIMPLITDTAVFLLTLLRITRYSEDTRSMPILRLLVRDGTLYYFCIFSANLLNVIMFLAATEDLKAIGAGFSQILTCVMVSRLVLNLRNARNESAGTGQILESHSVGIGNWAAAKPEGTYKRSRLDTMFGALSEEPSRSMGYADDSSTVRGSLNPHTGDAIALTSINAGSRNLLGASPRWQGVQNHT